MIHTGDSVEVMRTLPDASVDAVVTDPPYGLEFMGKEWDRLDAGLPQENVWKGRRGKGGSNIGTDDSRPGSRHHVSFSGTRTPGKRCQKCGKRSFSGSPCKCPDPEWVLEYPPGAPSSMIRMQRWHEQWATEAFRVLKPGGYLLAFGGTRTVHRLASAIEDAGFEIRDELVWIYASGFPKSLNLTGDRQGWGTALKPAHEPIVMARKPLVGTVAGNVTRYGTGALNIDGARIPGAAPYVYPDGPKGNVDPTSINLPRIDGERVESHPAGRWPSNILLSDPELFDQPNPYVVGSGATTTVPGTYTSKPRNEWAPTSYAGSPPGDTVEGYGDSGGYSRFFIIPKADRAEREPVLRGQLTNGKVGGRNRADGRQWDIPGSTVANGKPDRGNTHPTVKPVDLMRHLVRLVTPPGGTVLDPFLGSGTTAIACELEGFPWIGIEKEPEYVAIAEARLNGTQRGLGLDTPLEQKRKPNTSHWPARRSPHKADGWGFSSGQMDLEERTE